jgi:hypothetical protein
MLQPTPKLPVFPSSTYGTTSTSKNTVAPKDMALKEEEAAVYDRQLRVWGVETQRK